jgi:hypothetical protein
VTKKKQKNVFLVLCGEKHEGATVYGAHSTPEPAIAQAKRIEKEGSFMRCDYVEVLRYAIDGDAAGEIVYTSWK